MSWMSDMEKRGSRRIYTELPIRFTVAGATGAGTANHALTTSVSASGVSFVTPLSIPIDTRLELAIQLPAATQDLRATARVARIVSEAPEDRVNEYGAMFDPPLGDEALAHYIRSIDVTPLLELMTKKGASHLHLCADGKPLIRIGQDLEPAINRLLSAATVEALLLGTMNPARHREFQRFKDIEFPLIIPNTGAWHVNVFQQRGLTEGVFHWVSPHAPTIEELGLPDSLRGLALDGRGLLLIAGPRSSGKSATTAALISALTQERRRIITTIEQRIEFLHRNGLGIVRQRETGFDVRNAEDALEFAIRHNPDVIAVDPVKNPSMMDTILHAAESGYLVIITMPASNAVDALERLAGTFPREQRDITLHRLSVALCAVSSQLLLPRLDSAGLVLCPELLIPSDGIRHAIRHDKFDQVRLLAETTPGCRTLDASLRALVLKNTISRDLALALAQNREHLERALGEH